MPVTLGELLRLIASAEGFGVEEDAAPTVNAEGEEEDAPLAPGMAS